MILKQGVSSLIDARTAAQLRFKSAARFLAPLRGLIQLGLKTKRKGKTPVGRAMSHILTCGFVGEFPKLEIDPAKVKLSDGSLTNPLKIEASRQGNTLRVTWCARPAMLPTSAYQDDGIIVCAYAIAARTAVLNETDAQRKDEETVVILPKELTEETVHVYLMSHSRDKKYFSKNIYVGEFTA